MNNGSKEIRQYVTHLFKRWYIFLFTLLITFSSIFIYLRYADEVYSIKTSILIRDKYNDKVGAENIIEGLEIFSISKNLDNEIEVIRSYSLIRKTIEKLHLDVTYYSEGKVKQIELYDRAPFIIYPDTNHVQLENAKFKIQIKDDDSFDKL